MATCFTKWGSFQMTYQSGGALTFTKLAIRATAGSAIERLPLSSASKLVAQDSKPWTCAYLQRQKKQIWAVAERHIWRFFVATKKRWRYLQQVCIFKDNATPHAANLWIHRLSQCPLRWPWCAVPTIHVGWHFRQTHQQWSGRLPPTLRWSVFHNLITMFTLNYPYFYLSI